MKDEGHDDQNVERDGIAEEESATVSGQPWKIESGSGGGGVDKVEEEGGNEAEEKGAGNQQLNEWSEVKDEGYDDLNSKRDGIAEEEPATVSGQPWMIESEAEMEGEKAA